MTGTSRTLRESNGPLKANGRVRVISRIALAIVLLLLAVWVAQDFLIPLGWAVLIAITCWPLYRRFADLFSSSHRRILAPLLFTALVAFILFLPVALAVHQATAEGQAIAESFAYYRKNGIAVPEWLPSVPAIGEHVSRWWQANLSDVNSVGAWIGYADTKNDAAMTQAIGLQILHRSFLFAVALIALFGLLQQGAWIANRALDAADNVLGERGERLASRIVEAVRGTVHGTMTIAIVEGPIIGVAYFLIGISKPLLFTLLTMAFAMLPFGAWAMFTTAGLMHVLGGGSTSAAVGLFCFGAFVMLIGDALVWPKLVGDAVRLPFLVALIGIFGGLHTFGLIGLFLGPVIMAAFFTVLREWIFLKT
jgi:predicted PurR-regulated permease PerM